MFLWDFSWKNEQILGFLVLWSYRLIKEVLGSHFGVTWWCGVRIFLELLAGLAKPVLWSNGDWFELRVYQNHGRNNWYNIGESDLPWKGVR